MPKSSTPSLVTLEPVVVAAVREAVPMGKLPAFFARAFHAAMEAARAQGVAVVGPPLGVYFGMPTETVDVAAGFPTAGPVAADESGVAPVTLPGGRAAQVLHVGSYDSMEQTYGRLVSWLGEQGLAPGSVMWETYLSEATPEAPESMQTLITWPLAE